MGWLTVFIICCAAIFLIIALILTTLYVISYRQRQKKKHNFGIKKVKSSVCRSDYDDDDENMFVCRYI